MCCGRTPMETLIDGKEVYKQKQILNLDLPQANLDHPNSLRSEVVKGVSPSAGGIETHKVSEDPLQVHGEEVLITESVKA